MKKTGILFSVFVFLLVSSAFAQSSARVIIDEMIRSMDRIHTISARLERKERINGKLNEGDLRFKLMMEPHKVYIYNNKPDEGSEVMYIKGWNGGDAFVHPNKFPWVNVSLDPYGDLMTENQHHSLHAVGFDFFNTIVKHLLKKYEKDFDKYVSYGGKKTYKGREVHVLNINYDDYGYENYTIQGKENLLTLEWKLKVPAMKIIEINSNVDGFLDVKPGQTIKVPNIYGNKIVLYVDLKSFLPIYQEIYDDKGLFEVYDYTEIKINPSFPTNTFSTSNPEYGF